MSIEQPREETVLLSGRSSHRFRDNADTFSSRSDILPSSRWTRKISHSFTILLLCFMPHKKGRRQRVQPVGEHSALHTLGFRVPRSGSAGPLQLWVFFPSPVLICLAGDVTFLGGTCRSAEWELGEISKQNKTGVQSERREGAGFVAGTLLSKDRDYGILRPSLVIPLFLPFGTFPRFSLRTVTTKCFPAESCRIR